MAGLAAGLAATQNPPLVFLGGAAVLAAAWERRWWSAVFAAAGTALVFAPFAFFQYHFGSPNLIAAGAEYVGPGNLSLVRTWGLLADVNHGLLPFAPVLVVGTLAGAVRLAYTRNVRGLILLAGGVGDRGRGPGGPQLELRVRRPPAVPGLDDPGRRRGRRRRAGRDATVPAGIDGRRGRHSHRPPVRPTSAPTP